MLCVPVHVAGFSSPRDHQRQCAIQCFLETGKHAWQVGAGAGLFDCKRMCSQRSICGIVHKLRAQPDHDSWHLRAAIFGLEFLQIQLQHEIGAQAARRRADAGEICRILKRLQEHFQNQDRCAVAPACILVELDHTGLRKTTIRFAFNGPMAFGSAVLQALPSTAMRIFIGHCPYASNCTTWRQ